MKKQILFILLIALVIVILVLFFILYGHNLSNLIKRFTNSGANTNQENIVTRGDVGEIMIQLKDAESELNKLKELAQDQEGLSKIDQLFTRTEYFKTELKKPRKEIDKKVLEEFYNSGFWESIVDLKSKLEGTKQENGPVPELE